MFTIHIYTKFIRLRPPLSILDLRCTTLNDLLVIMDNPRVIEQLSSRPPLKLLLVQRALQEVYCILTDFLQSLYAVVYLVVQDEVTYALVVRAYYRVLPCDQHERYYAQTPDIRLE